MNSSISKAYRSLADKPYESQYLYIEAVLNRPLKKVWEQAIHISRWMTDHRLVPLSGEPGERGFFEKVYSSDAAPDAPEPRYHLYGIAELIPHQLIALEVFPEHGGSYGNTREWMAFDSILFKDLGDKTQIGFLQIHVEMGRAQEGATPQSHDDAPMRKRLQQYFANLEKLID